MLNVVRKVRGKGWQQLLPNDSKNQCSARGWTLWLFDGSVGGRCSKTTNSLISLAMTSFSENNISMQTVISVEGCILYKLMGNTGIDFFFLFF